MKEEFLEIDDDRKEKITLIVQTLYNANDFLRDIPLDVLIQKALDKYLDSDLSISEIRGKLLEEVNNKLAEYNARYDKDKVKANHEMIYSKLKQLAKRLDEEGVDYYLAGALCGYIKFGEESNRCHDDIDININEKDLDKFKKICKEMGLIFKDKRFDSPRVLENGICVGDHEVLAEEEGSDFHIGAFPFERLADGTVISKGYYKDEDGKPCCREIIYSSSLASEILSDRPVNFDGQPIYVSAPEYVYMLKKYTNKSKDKADIKFLEDKINKDKVKRIEELSKTDEVTQFSKITNIPTVEEEEKEETSEMDEMFVEEKKEEVVTDKPKKMVKSDNNDSKRGAASISSILLVVLIAVFFVLIGLITYYAFIK